MLYLVQGRGKERRKKKAKGTRKPSFYRSNECAGLAVVGYLGRKCGAVIDQGKPRHKLSTTKTHMGHWGLKRVSGGG